MKILFIPVVLVLLNSCSIPIGYENPEWVSRLVTSFENEPVGNPPKSIWKYNYDGDVVYYVPAQCCDNYSTLFNAEGVIICSPDGGLDGMGDGKCPDFFSKRTNEELVWRDDRE